MPPRYAYWTILIGDEPTAFRAGALEDIMPTFNRLKEKQPTAVLKWFQNGKLWTSRIEARESMAYRGDKGRRRDPRQAGVSEWRGKPAISDRMPDREQKPEWRPKQSGPPARTNGRPAEPEWKPATFARSDRPRAPVDKSGARPEWKPKGAARPDWKPRAEGAKPAWKPSAFARSDRPRPSADKNSGARPEWKPRADEKRSKPEWKPKSPPRAAETTTGRSDVRDKKWRPGGEHKDPRQKYKDAKKAKWTRFKQAIRARTGHKKKPDG